MRGQARRIPFLPLRLGRLNFGIIPARRVRCSASRPRHPASGSPANPHSRHNPIQNVEKSQHTSLPNGNMAFSRR